MLIFDNFKGHLDHQAFEYPHANHVFIISLPPHTSDKTQPLDLSVFGPFEAAYKKKFGKVLQQYVIKKITSKRLFHL